MRRLLIVLIAQIIVTGCSQVSYRNIESGYKAESKDSSIVYGKARVYDGFQLNGSSNIGICDPQNRCKVFPKDDSGYFAIKVKTGFYIVKMIDISQGQGAATTIANDNYSGLRFRVQHPGRWYYLGNFKKMKEDEYIKTEFNKYEIDNYMKLKYKYFKSDSNDVIEIN